MPVRYTPPRPEELLPVPGVTLGTAAAKVKNWERDDVLLAVFEPGTAAAGVFTQNRFSAAPVIVCRRHLERAAGIRALVVNAGNANAGTGAEEALGVRAVLELPTNAILHAEMHAVGDGSEHSAPFIRGARIGVKMESSFSTVPMETLFFKVLPRGSGAIDRVPAEEV